MLMLPWIFKLNNYISENFYRPPPFLKCNCCFYHISKEILLYIYSPLLGIPDYIFGMRMYMRFSSANPLCLTRIISPAFSSSFRERLTVISHRESSAASCLTGKYTNRIPFSSSSFFVSMASSILQYITFAVLLIGSPASAFGNGIQGGSGVAAVINSYSIFLFLPSFCVLFWGCFGQKHSGQNPFFHAALSPCQCRQGRVMPLPAYCVIHILVQSSRFFLMPFLPPVSPAAFCSLWCARCGRDFHSFHSSWHHFVWGAYPISPVMRLA